jgi:beta-phosphoglucomutase-like phosphatase (HAD superfamily)
MKKLIIFDCDGVLVDSEFIGNRVYAEMLTSFGYSISTEESIKKFTGLDDQTIRDIVFRESDIALPENVSQQLREALLCVLEVELKPLMFNILNNRIFGHFKKCVASNSPREHVLSSLITTKQNHFFEDSHIFTSSQVKNGKPAPDLFLFAAEQMGVSPENCLVIEDSIAGIQAARSAQMSVIGFLGGSHAKFDWYQEKIKSQNVPVAFCHDDLLALVDNFIYEVSL